MAQPTDDNKKKYQDLPLFQEYLKADDWRREKILDEMVRSEGQTDPLEVGLFLRDEFLKGLSETTKREIAVDLAIEAETDLKPRTMGLSKTDEHILKGVWFNEVVVFRKSGGGHGEHDFYDWWDPNNAPPQTEKPLEDGADYEVIELPLRGSDMVDEETIRHFGSEHAARIAAWDIAAENYTDNMAYKINRGDAEKWASTIEPHVVLEQLAQGQKELTTPDLHEWYLNNAEMDYYNLNQKKHQLQAKGKELSDEEDKLYKYLQGQIRRIYANSALRDNPLILGKDWRKQTVVTIFRGFSTVGSKLFRKIFPSVADALARTRRTQGRLMRIVGLEVDVEEGGGQVDPDHVHYERLSEAYDYNEALANAIITRSGVETAKVRVIEKRLNEYRAMMGRLPIIVNNNFGTAARGGATEAEKKSEAGKQPPAKGKEPGAAGGASEADEEKKTKDAEIQKEFKRKKHEELQKKFPPPSFDGTLRDWERLHEIQKTGAWKKYYTRKVMDPLGDKALRVLEDQKKKWENWADPSHRQRPEREEEEEELMDGTL